MDFESVAVADFGRSLSGIGLNLLCRDVRGMAAFLRDVLGLEVFRLSDDFAIIRHDGMLMQLHRDGTYGAHPLLGLVPEMPPRGGGMQIFLFGLDPDAVVARANPASVIEPARDKPHGLREATILSPEGHAFTPARPS